MRLTYLIKKSWITLKEGDLILLIKKIINYILNKNKINLDELIKDSPNNLDDIFIKFGTDKGSLDGKKSYDFIYKKNNQFKFKNYLDWINRPNLKNYEYQYGLNSTPIYEKIFKNRKFENLKILEIGVANGHSIASWHHYFPNSRIFGIDHKKPFKFFYQSKRIKYNEINILDEDKVKNFIKQNGSFDYIIDDSLNTHEAMLKNLKNFFPFVKSGGAYFLEDYGFYDHEKKAMQDVKKFNLKNKMQYFLDCRTMTEILENIRNQNIFKDDILDKDIQKYFHSNISKIEFGNYDHPHASIAIFFKK